MDAVAACGLGSRFCGNDGWCGRVLRLGKGSGWSLAERSAEEFFCGRHPVARGDFLAMSAQDLYEQPAHVPAVVGLAHDELLDLRVYGLPPLAGALYVGSVVGDEVGSVVVSVYDEQSGCGEPVANHAAVDAVVHHVDEDAGDVSAVVGVVSDELG